MDKYVKSLYDRLEGRTREQGIVFSIMDNAINEMHNNGIFSQLPEELQMQLHSSDPEERVRLKTSLAKSITSKSFIPFSNPMVLQGGGLAHQIKVMYDPRFVNSIALCIQGGLEGLYLAGMYKHCKNGIMDYYVEITSNGRNCSDLCSLINELDRMYDCFHICITTDSPLNNSEIHRDRSETVELSKSDGSKEISEKTENNEIIGAGTKKSPWKFIVFGLVAVAIIAFICVRTIVPKIKLNNVQDYLNEKEYEKAAKLSEELLLKSNLKDTLRQKASEYFKEARYGIAGQEADLGHYNEAADIYREFGDLECAREVLTIEAEKAFAAGEYESAALMFEKYEENDKAKESWYRFAAEKVNAKDYQRALEIYEKLNDNDQINKVFKVQADEALSQGEYSSAAELYEKCGESEKAQETWYLFADNEVSQKQFESAIEVYDRFSDSTRSRETREKWAEYCVSVEEFDKAIGLYQGMSLLEKVRDVKVKKAEAKLRDGKPEEISVLLSGYSGSDIADLCFRGAKAYSLKNGEPLADSAGEYGRIIKDVNTQLEYCNLLKGEKLDLKEVYPNGVGVDVSLNKYQFYNSNDKLELGIFSKILVFSRHEIKPRLKSYSTDSKIEADEYYENLFLQREKDTFQYGVTIEPGLMQDLPELMVAASWEDCDTVILLESGYLPEGRLSINSYGPYDILKNNPVKYEIFPYYEKYEGVMAYDLKNVNSCSVLDAELFEPPARNCVIGNAYSDAGIDLNSLDIEGIKKALENEESEESKQILSKYSADVLDLIRNNSNGSYVLFPDYDENGKTKNFKGTSENTKEWYIEKYMIGTSEDGLARQMWKGLFEE